MIEFAAESHPGNRYQHNEDSLGWSEEAGVWLVADGMGGHACGDVASRVAKQSVLKQLTLNDYAEDLSLTELISHAHDAVVDEGVRRSTENMGSTIVVLRLFGAIAQIGWCGDSRVYLQRDNELVRLTRDHSLLEQLLESGVVEPTEAFGHPQKHVLVQALGITNPPPVPAQLEVELASDDMLLLCSDGLHDELRDEDIAALLKDNPQPSGAVAALVKRVLEGPARDNVSVVCLKVHDLERSSQSQKPLSVEQLRERFERLPGRRVQIKASPDAVTPVHTPRISLNPPAKMASPKVAHPIKTDEKGRFSEIDRDLIIAVAAVGVLVAMLLWLA